MDSRILFNEGLMILQISVFFLISQIIIVII